MTKWLHFHFSLSCIGEGNGNPLQCSCLENPRYRGAWWAAIYGVAQSQTQLKRLSSSSSSSSIVALFFSFFMEQYCSGCTNLYSTDCGRFIFLHTLPEFIVHKIFDATSCKELTHWKRLWCWEGLWAGGEGDDRGWDGWMASQTQWTWVWVNSRSWWWTGRPGVLQFRGSQRVGHNWATELNWNLESIFFII